MKTMLTKILMRPARYLVRQVLQRPWLKKQLRDLLMTMPGLHRVLMRVMFQAPAPVQRKVSMDLKNLSPQAQRVQRALKQAARSARH